MIDELIIDFKQANEEKHKEYTGISNKNIRENIKKACIAHSNVHIRTPLIAEFNGDVKYIPEFLEFFSSLDCRCIEFEFLEYHEYGKNKWKQCGMNYQIQKGYVSETLRRKYEEAFINANLKIVRT